MYYFIPAWYGQTDEFWKTAIDPWYRIRQKLNLMTACTKFVFFRMRI